MAMSNERILEELENITQLVENMSADNMATVLDQCACCGADIRSGNACVEFRKVIEQFEKNADDTTTGITIDDEVVALLCAHCGNRYSDIRKIRQELAKELGLDELKDIPWDGSAVPPVDTPYECDICNRQMVPGNARVAIEILISQVNKVGDEDRLYIPIRADEIIVACARCSGEMDKEQVTEAVKRLIAQRGGGRPGDSIGENDIEADELIHDDNEERERQLYEKKSQLLQRALQRAKEMDEEQGLV